MPWSSLSLLWPTTHKEERVGMVLGYRPQKCVLQVRRWVEDHGSPLWWRDGPEREKHHNYICWWGYTLIIWSYTRNWVRTFLIGYQYLKNRETSHKNLSVRYFLKERKKKKKDYLVTLNLVLWRKGLWQEWSSGAWLLEHGTFAGYFMYLSYLPTH